MPRRREEEELEVGGGFGISPTTVAVIVALLVAAFLFRGNLALLLANVQQSLGKLGAGLKVPQPAQPAAKGAMGSNPPFSVAAVVGGEQAGTDGVLAAGEMGVGSAANPSAHHMVGPYQRRVSDFSGGIDDGGPSALAGRVENDFAARIVAGNGAMSGY